MKQTTNHQMSLFSLFFFSYFGGDRRIYFGLARWKKTKQLSQRHFPSLTQFVGREVGTKGGRGRGMGGGFSHFRLRDLGHTLTVWLTSGWWVRKPGVDLEPHFSCDWPWPSDLLLWPVFISPFTGKRLDESEVCPDFYTCAWVLIRGHVAAEVHTCM